MIIIDSIIFSLQRFGGISNLFSELVRRLIDDEELDVYVAENYTGEDNIFRRGLEIPKEQVLRKSSRVMERYRDVKLGLKGRYVYHSSYYRVSRDRNAVNVTTVHDFSYEKFIKNPLAKCIHHCQKRHAVRHSDAIVCVSENTKQDLMHYFPFVDPNKVVVIYNGVSDSFYPIEREVSFKNDTILFVGGRDRYKNAKFVVDSISDTNYHIIFCGKELTKQEQKYYDMKLGNERYSVESNVSIEHLNILMNSVKCLVYPSSYEGFGIPVIEAQKAGCPVIALYSSSIPEVIGDTLLLLQNLSKEEFLSKLSLLDDENVRKTVIEKGLENCKRFTWDETYREYAYLYKSVMIRD